MKLVLKKNMSQQKFLIIFFIIFISNLKAQSILKGKVISNNIPVEYASVKSKVKGMNQYTDPNGTFVIDTLISDTLVIQCIGYITKEIFLKDYPNELIIELEEKTEVLKELTISINNNEKSKWKKINKRTKRFDSTHQGVAEGYSIISTYKIDEELKFNGIRLFIMTNILNDDLTTNNNFNKKVRPILIVNSDKLEDNILPNEVISLNNDVDLFSKLDIEFKNTIHLLPNEILTIGLELIPENLDKPNLNNVMGVLTTKHLLKESETYFKNLFSKKINTEVLKLDEDLYFELKVVK